MMDDEERERVRLDDSAKPAPRAAKIDTMDTSESIEISVLVRRRRDIEAALSSGRRYTREEYEHEFGAAREDLDAVAGFAVRHHLTVTELNVAGRIVKLRGTIADLEHAFQVQLSHYRDSSGVVYRGRSGEVSVPTSLDGIIEGVFGLDNRPHARPKFQVLKKSGVPVRHAAASSSYFPNQLAQIYGFPAQTTGKGECIGIIELGGGYRNSDLDNYFSLVGLQPPVVTSVSVDGAANTPSTPDGADGEVMLDIEVAGAVAPGARVTVYFAPNTDRGFLDAITTAVHDKVNAPTVISISWGEAEVNWTVQAMKAFDDAFKSASLMGVTVCVAAGDRGSSDGIADGKVHVDFPASSPYVLACGGTRLATKEGKIVSEVAWHESNSSATGGGVSNFFAIPAYQNKAGVPSSLDTGFKGRGVPDVAADADPETGYKTVVDGEEMVIGGTSAVAPLMAALVARVNEANKKPIGFINPIVYSHPLLCRDITKGNNTTTSTGEGYSAGKGWDACTGLGVPSTFVPK